MYPQFLLSYPYSHPCKLHDTSIIDIEKNPKFANHENL